VQSLGRATARIDRWLEHFFFGLMEVLTLAIPTMWLLVAAPNHSAVSLSALVTLAVSSAAVGTFRGGYVDVGWWPRPGHLSTLPIRSAYYSLVLGAATWSGVQVQLATSSTWLGVVVPTLVTVVVLWPFPRLLRTLGRASQWDLDDAL
jgi:hypothetical protein